MSELGDDEALHSIGNLEPEIIEVLRRIRHLPQKIRDQLALLIIDPDPGRDKLLDV